VAGLGVALCGASGALGGASGALVANKNRRWALWVALEWRKWRKKWRKWRNSGALVALFFGMRHQLTPCRTVVCAIRWRKWRNFPTYRPSFAFFSFPAFFLSAKKKLSQESLSGKIAPLAPLLA
jgi:hypothetical protein